jgi:biotin carboxyl carrier protein
MTEFFARIGDHALRTRPAPQGVEVEGPEATLQIAVDLPLPDGSPVRSVRLNGASHRVLAERSEDGTWILRVDGIRHEVQLLDRGQQAAREARQRMGGGGPTPLKAPMPGLVVRVEVEPGDRVRPGDGLVIVEAMKMENELKASHAARVRAVYAVPGTAVEKDTVLVEFEAEEMGEDA